MAVAADVKLSALGSRSMQEWVDFVRDGHDFDDVRRQKLINSIYDVRKQAAETVLTQEVSRLGLIKPKQRGTLAYTLADNSSYAQQIRRRAEQQAAKIIETDRKFRERWAEQVKQEALDQKIIRNRYQLANELKQEVERKNVWKSRQVAETEFMQGASEAVTDFYAQSGISDPQETADWYFVGPKDHRTCERCMRIIEGNPYTLDGLTDALASVGAMSPSSFVVHPHERHQADYRPKPGFMRRVENRDKAKLWTNANGKIGAAATGVAMLAAAEEPQTLVPTFVPGRVPTNHYLETITPALWQRTCTTGGYHLRGLQPTQETLPNTGVGVAGPLCDTLRSHQCHDSIVRMVMEVFGGTPAPADAPFDFILEDMAFDVRAVRLEKMHEFKSRTANILEKQYLWAESHGKRVENLIGIWNEFDDSWEIHHYSGVFPMPPEVLLRIDRNGDIRKVARELPWTSRGVLPRFPRGGHIPALDHLDEIDNLSGPSLEQWLATNLNVKNVDFRGVVVEGQRDAAKQLVRLMDILPEGLRKDAEELLGLGSTHDLPDSAFAGTKRHQIDFNQPIFYGGELRYQHLKDELIANVQSHWHPPGNEGPESVLSHEFGHFLLGDGVWLPKPGYTGDDMTVGLLKVVPGTSISPVFGETLEKWVNKWGYKGIGPISDYAKSDPNEGFAEAFASLLHTPPSKWKAAVHDLKKELRRIGFRLEDMDFAPEQGVLDFTGRTVGFGVARTPQLTFRFSTTGTGGPKLLVTKIGGHIPAVARLPEIEKLTDSHAINKWLADNLGIDTELQDMNPEPLRDIAQQLVKTLDVLPDDVRELAQSRLKLRMDENMGGLLFARATPSGRIVFDTGYFRDVWELRTKDLLAANEKEFLHPQGVNAPGGLLAHEFGHFVFGSEIRHQSSEARNRLLLMGLPDLTKDVGPIPPLKPGLRKIVAEWAKEFKQAVSTGELGIAATQNDDEAFASAFASILRSKNVTRSTLRLRKQLREAGFDLPDLDAPVPVKVTPAEFRVSLAKVEADLQPMLSHYTDEEMKDFDLYLMKGLDAGFGVKKNGEIFNVHNASGHPGLGVLMVRDAIDRGGTWLDHYDTPVLSKIYSAAGLKETSRMKWDPQYADPTWNYAKFGTPDVLKRELAIGLKGKTPASAVAAARARATRPGNRLVEDALQARRRPLPHPVPKARVVKSEAAFEASLTLKEKQAVSTYFRSEAARTAMKRFSKEGRAATPEAGVNYAVYRAFSRAIGKAGRLPDKVFDLYLLDAVGSELRTALLEGSSFITTSMNDVTEDLADLEREIVGRQIEREAGKTYLLTEVRANAAVRLKWRGKTAVILPKGRRLRIDALGSLVESKAPEAVGQLKAMRLLLSEW